MADETSSMSWDGLRAGDVGDRGPTRTALEEAAW